MAYPGEQLGDVKLCSDKVFRQVNALNRRLPRRSWQLKVSDKCFSISHDFGPTVKITFARNGNGIQFHEFLLRLLIISKNDCSIFGDSYTRSMCLFTSISDPSDLGGLK